MIVSELMKSDPATVAPETTVLDAARIMLALRVSGLPVVVAGHLAGMVTEGDLLRRPELDTATEKEGWLAGFFTPSRLAAAYVHTHGRLVGDVMTPTPISVTPETQLEEAAKLMMAKRIKRLPVEADDTGVRSYIEKELKNHSWTPKVGLHVHVTNHVVTLEGSIFSDAEREAVRLIAGNAPGVRAVVDHLVYVDPGSGMAFPAA
jgi:CBS domain-containing protein